MEKQFSGAGKTETGGTKVILACQTKCHVPPRDGGVRKNSIEQVEKKRSDFYNNRAFAGGLLLIISQNPFAERKTLPNTGATQLVPTGEMDEKIEALVTTSHLLLSSQRGKAAFWLPIPLPNSDFLNGNTEGPRGRRLN